MNDSAFSLFRQSHELDQLIAKARSFMQAAKAPSTHVAYKGDFRVFSEWCEANHLSSMPSNSPTVCLFLTNEASQGRAWSTIARRVVAINQAHKAAGIFDSPASRRNPIVSATLKGIRRTLGAAPKHTKAPLIADGIRALVAGCPTTLLGLRDRSLCLLGFSAGLRCDSLARLDVSDITNRAHGEGIAVMLVKSKTDQDGAGQVVNIPFGTEAETCPVLALRAWLSAAKILGHGPIYRAVDRWGNVSPHGLNTDSISRIIRTAAERAGLPNPSDFGGRSLRSGLVTQCAISGVSPFVTMETTQHKSLAVLRLYARLGYLSHGLDAAALGL
jgi:site-specific recombinase XerD